MMVRLNRNLLTLGIVLGLIFSLEAPLAKAGPSSQSQSTPLRPLNREMVFIKAFELLPSVLEVASDMGLVNNDFVGPEFFAFSEIRRVVLSDFDSGKKDRLQFSEDQNLFSLDPKQPVRTAVTSSNPKDPIYINLKVINDASGMFELEDALQILIHEYGHKTTNKIQTVVDSVAAKIRGFIIGHIHHEISENGSVLTAVALPTMTGSSGLAKLISSQNRRSLLSMTSALLFQNGSKVVDLSSEWEKFLKQHSGFKSLKSSIHENTEIRLWEVAFSKTVGAPGSTSELYNIEFMKSDVASPTGQPGVGTTTSDRDGSGLSSVVRGNAPDMRAQISIDHMGAKMNSIFMDRVLVPHPNLKAKIAHLQRTDHDRFEIGIQIATPFDFRKAKLLLESEDGQFSLLAKTVWPGHDRILFDVKLPRAQVEKNFNVRAFITDNRAQVMLDEGITLQALATKVNAGVFRLESLRFGDGERTSSLGSSQPLNPENTKMILLIESPQEIQELRLESRKDLKVLAPSAYTTPGDTKIYDTQDLESVRSDYEIRYLDRSEFTQVRHGNLIEVTVPMKDKIYHFDAGVFSDDPRAPRNSVVARDDGDRAITGLEVIDASLRSLRLIGDGESLSYQLITPVTPAPRNRNTDTVPFGKSASKDLCRRALISL